MGEGLKVKVTVKAWYDRPSGYRLSPSFTPETGKLNHEETISCPHAKEHAELFLHFLDVIGYDCGVRGGEFKEFAGRAAKVKQLTEELWKVGTHDKNTKLDAEPKEIDTTVICDKCQRQERVSFAECMRKGWPVCHGHTMRMDETEANIEEAIAVIIGKREIGPKKD